MASTADRSSRPLPRIADVIEKIGFGCTHCRFICTGGGVWFADGSELLLISAVTSSVAREWSLDALERGSMVTLVYLGVFLGNLVSGPLGDKYGRRQLILSSYIGIFVFSLVSSFMASYFALCFWRVFVGLSFGLGQPPWNVLATEVTPAKWRVVSNGISQALFSLGEVYSSLLILANDPTMQNLDWRQLLQLGAIPAFLFWVAGSFFLQQSPYYLAQSGRSEEAREVLTIMQRDNCLPNFSVDFSDPPVTIPDESSAAGVCSQWQKLTQTSLLTTTLIMAYTCFAVNVVYYGSLYAFPNLLPALLVSPSEGVSAKVTSPAFQLMVGAVWELPGIAIACALGSCMPRKPCLKLYGFITVVAILLFVNGATGEQSFLKVVAWHIGYYVIKCSVQTGWVIAYIYITEVYPTSVRTTGCSINIAAGRLGAVISPLVYEKLKEATDSFAPFFYVLASLVFVNMMMINFLPFETFNVALSDNLEDMKTDYGSAEQTQERPLVEPSNETSKIP